MEAAPPPVGLSGSVVGVGVVAQIELACGGVEQAEVANVEFRVAGLADGLGEEEYDVVYARFVLTHLSDPAAGVATMVAALKPGGRLVVEDIDFRGSFCHPEHPSFERYNEIYTRGGVTPTAATRTSPSRCRCC